MISTPSDSPANPGKGIRRVFMGRQGLRIGWRLILFVVIMTVAAIGVMIPFRHFAPFDPAKPLALNLALVQESLEVLIVAVATFVMARIERKSPLSYGYLGDHKSE
jgi:uncharacterized protein